MGYRENMADDHWTEFGSAGEPADPLAEDVYTPRRPLCPRCDGYGLRAGCTACHNGYLEEETPCH